jgi:copper oxidase (laccase) domain-containing protein
MDGPLPAGVQAQQRVERFAALAALGLRHGFIGRVVGVDVRVDRDVALARLDACHQHARRRLGLGELPFVTAQQVHGNEVCTLTASDPLPNQACAGVDALVTNRDDVCLGIYVADCCAVYLVDPVRRVVGLAHSGKKGTELNIAAATVHTMTARFGSDPRDVVAQLGPCIRPPWYEIDFAATIVTQCRQLGLSQVHDCGICTAANPEEYYSYRREEGRTGRMLALLALA